MSNMQIDIDELRRLNSLTVDLILGLPMKEEFVKNIRQFYYKYTNTFPTVDLKEHDRRVTELLNANNALVERERKAKRNLRNAFNGGFEISTEGCNGEYTEKTPEELESYLDTLYQVWQAKQDAI